MDFSVIYSADCPRDISITQFRPPPEQMKLWKQTEGDSEYGFSYLGGRWTTGKHRKWCAILDREQFDAFIRFTYLVAQDVATMGSIGAPGCGYGCVPAFSFDGTDEDALQNAYVTPLAGGPEMARFIREVNEEFDLDIVVPSVLENAPGQQYLFEGVEDDAGTGIEESVRRALCAVYG